MGVLRKKGAECDIRPLNEVLYVKSKQRKLKNEAFYNLYFLPVLLDYVNNSGRSDTCSTHRIDEICLHTFRWTDLKDTTSWEIMPDLGGDCTKLAQDGIQRLAFVNALNNSAIPYNYCNFLSV